MMPIAVSLLCVLVILLIGKVLLMSQASDRLTASVAALAASVDALLAKPAKVDDAPLTAAADAVDALKVKVDAAVLA